MDEILLLSDNDITTNTPLGGNIDVDKYRFCIQDAQISQVEEILGTLLYEKIKLDYKQDQLTGSYETLYRKYIKPFLIHRSALEYILVGAFSINNSGIFKFTPSNGTPIEKVDVDFIANNQRMKANMYKQRLEQWLCKNHLEEYRCADQIVNPERKANKGEWYF